MFREPKQASAAVNAAGGARASSGAALVALW
jgi:hypothetical protein